MIGRFIAPVFRPLGFEDWRIATSLIAGFTAKESVVSTLGVLLGVSTSELAGALGSLFTPLSAFAFLTFVLLYTPCVAAVATVRREMGSARAAAVTVVVQCAIAWVVAFIVREIGLLMGFV